MESQVKDRAEEASLFINLRDSWKELVAKPLADMQAEIAKNVFVPFVQDIWEDVQKENGVVFEDGGAHVEIVLDWAKTKCIYQYREFEISIDNIIDIAPQPGSNMYWVPEYMLTKHKPNDKFDVFKGGYPMLFNTDEFTVDVGEIVSKPAFFDELVRKQLGEYLKTALKEAGDRGSLAAHGQKLCLRLSSPRLRMYWENYHVTFSFQGHVCITRCEDDA